MSWPTRVPVPLPWASPDDDGGEAPLHFIGRKRGSQVARRDRLHLLGCNRGLVQDDDHGCRRAHTTTVPGDAHTEARGGEGILEIALDEARHGPNLVCDDGDWSSCRLDLGPLRGQASAIPV